MLLTLGYGSLWTRGYENRATQTITALMGSGAVLYAIAFPIALLGGELYLILIYCLIFWSIGVIGYVLHHALSLALGWGVVISVLYFILQKNLFAVLIMSAQ